MFGLPTELVTAILTLMAGAVGWQLQKWFERRNTVRIAREATLRAHSLFQAGIRLRLAAIGEAGALKTHSDATVERMNNDPEFVAFIPSQSGNPVFDHFVEHLAALPPATMEPVIAFYGQELALDRLAQDMQRDDFRRLPSERRALLYCDYTDMLIHQIGIGESALIAIRNAINLEQCGAAHA